MKVPKHKHVLRNLHLRPFTRKLSDKEIHLAGLLACSLFTAFPSRLNQDSGRSVNSFRFITCRTHSYGDSAGFTPDFPFNPNYRGPDLCKCKGVE